MRWLPYLADTGPSFSAVCPKNRTSEWALEYWHSFRSSMLRQLESCRRGRPSISRRSNPECLESPWLYRCLRRVDAHPRRLETDGLGSSYQKIRPGSWSPSATGRSTSILARLPECEEELLMRIEGCERRAVLFAALLSPDARPIITGC